ncbi:MAG: selenocysteine-specific translation elongation factor [Gemmatimonadaceae bacterium]
MIIGTAGHIDHGKTALVHALTGVDTDRLPEEKRRGITIELGFAPLELDGVGTVGIVDVPGHEAFIRTMLAGATGVDLALLVVAADEGVMPQTREHLAILSLLGVRGGVVALTKRDAVDDEWAELVREDVRETLRGTLLADAPVIETSVVSGVGIETLRQLLGRQLHALPTRDAHDLFRMPIDRAFTVKGTGTVVTGTVWSGRVSADTPLTLYPVDRAVRVRGVQRHGAAATELLPGTRGAIALAGVALDEVSRGGVLVEDGGWVPSRVLRADVALLEDGERSLRPREWVRLHLGTTEVGARVVVAGGALVAGERRGARLVLDAPIVARAGDRFVLRVASESRTIGGGIVTDPSPAHRRPRPWAAGLGVGERLRLLVQEGGERGLAAPAIPIRLGIAPREVAPLLVSSSDWLVEASGRLFERDILASVGARMMQQVRDFHATHPLEEWMPMATLRASVVTDQEAFDVALAGVLRDGGLESRQGGVRCPGWVPVLDDALVREREWLVSRLRASGGEPPSVSDLRSERGGNDPIPLLRILERERLVVQVEPDRFYWAEALDGLVERLRRGMEPGKVYGPAELREFLGTSRKYLIPLLEYCDRQRITERRSEGRVLAR